MYIPRAGIRDGESCLNGTSRLLSPPRPSHENIPCGLICNTNTNSTTNNDNANSYYTYILT